MYSMIRPCEVCRRDVEFRSADNHEFWCSTCGYLRFGGPVAVRSASRRRRTVEVYPLGTWLDRSQPPD